MVNFSSNNVIVEGNISSTPHFQVHTALLAMKSTGPKEAYVTVSIGTVGEILDGQEKLNHPGFVKIRVNGEMFYTFARDLKDSPRTAGQLAGPYSRASVSTQRTAH